MTLFRFGKTPRRATFQDRMLPASLGPSWPPHRTCDAITKTFEDAFGGLWNDSFWNTTFGYSQHITTKTTGPNIEIKFEVPGFAKEDLKLSYDEVYGALHVSSLKEGNELSLTATFGQQLNQETIKATCENGILTVTAEFVKQEEPKDTTKTIKIE